jgi:hypothetical protein
MITTVIVDDVFRDSAADHVSSVLSNHGGAEVVNLSAFLTEAGVKFSPDSGHLIWDKATLYERFPDARSRRICNRVVSISRGTPGALDGQQAILSPNLVFYSYAMVLKEFQHVWGLPGMYSPVGNLLPLNLQWRLFGSKIRDIETPKFAYGFGFTKLDIHDFHQPLWKSPFDLYGWKLEEMKQNQIHPFVVDRPKGNPVFLYFVGNSADVFTLGSGREVDEATKIRLIQCASPIKDMFGAFMGEALFFADQGRLTFAAFSHYLKTSLTSASFKAVLESGLTQLDA